MEEQRLMKEIEERGHGGVEACSRIGKEEK